uniref:ORF67c n=1 Tax=Pinus thunbergii TaxID=3350 RepID=Q32992_PINTH|nr:ORF67c [Pinus thunbergii]
MIALLRPFLSNWSGQLMRSPLWVYGRSVTPGCLWHPWGDLVVPTGWRRWGRSMAWLFFPFTTFCSKG